MIYAFLNNGYPFCKYYYGLQKLRLVNKRKMSSKSWLIYKLQKNVLLLLKVAAKRFFELLSKNYLWNKEASKFMNLLETDLCKFIRKLHFSTPTVTNSSLIDFNCCEGNILWWENAEITFEKFIFLNTWNCELKISSFFMKYNLQALFFNRWNLQIYCFWVMFSLCWKICADIKIGGNSFLIVKEFVKIDPTLKISSMSKILI